jgi:hypothetical protein
LTHVKQEFLDNMPDNETSVLPPLGKTKDVLIRGMPELLWDQIGAAARRQDTTIAQFLVAHFERYGLDGVVVALPRQVPLIEDKRLSLIPDILGAVRVLGDMQALEPSTTRALNLLIRRQINQAKQPPPAA